VGMGLKLILIRGARGDDLDLDLDLVHCLY
jgi:hypothetical protein